MMQDVHVTLNSELPRQKKKAFFTSKLDLSLKKDFSKATTGGGPDTFLKVGHFGKYTRNKWKVLKCGAREGWRISFGPTE
jgi:hypothetical protein